MARIVLALQDPSNRRLAAAWLAQYYSVGEHVPGEPMEESGDLCVVDDAGLERFKPEIEDRRLREQPGIFPVLLVTRIRNVWARTRSLWLYVDDLVKAPVSKSELQGRIEILLRARRVSLELKLRNQDLEAFIQAMSHDLRTSIRAITMFADAIGVRPDGVDAEGRRNLDKIHQQAGEMRALIDSLLRFSRLGRGEIRRQPVELRSAIDQCLENLHAEIQSRKAVVRVRVRRLTVHTDASLLKIALTNLLSNAVKFVAAGVTPEVAVVATVRRDVCRIEIRDNGIGLALGDRQRIFTPFVRLHHEGEFPGVGLGLPSVRKALELMEGRVGVRSRPGAGSTFWIEFPAGPEPG